MANSTYGPKLIVYTEIGLNLGRQQVFRDLYRGDDGNDYIISAGYMTNASTDSIWAIKQSDGTTSAEYLYAEVKTGLTKNLRYTFALHNRRVYICNGTDLVFWIYCNAAGTWSTGYIVNNPNGNFIISAKNRLWIGGDTTSYYKTGTASFTQHSYSVTGASTTWETAARAGDFITNATEYTGGTAAFTKGSAAVVGTTTLWVANVSVGDWVQLDADAVYYQVASITDNTHLTLVKEYEDDGSAAAAYTAITPGTTFYKIAKVTSDTALTLDEQFNEAGDAPSTYFIKRLANDVIYWSSEECLNDWTVSGVVGGGDDGLIKINKRNVGLHNFDDAVLFFHETGGDYIFGTDESTWTIPKATKLPVTCISHDSIISHNGMLGFLSSKGYYITKGSALTFSDLGAEPYSQLVTSLFTDIDKNVATLAQSFVYKDSLFISVPAVSKYSTTDSQLGYSTGTVAVSDASADVTGTSTVWRGVIFPGDQIRFGTDTDTEGNPLYYEVDTVTTDTALTLTSNKSGVVATGSYAIRKRRNNRIVVLDTRTNIKKVNYGWTVYDDINPDGFVVYKDTLIYGSSTTGYLYQYDTGTQLYGGAITAYAKTKRMDCKSPGVRKFFKAFKFKAKGSGVVYITPYVDGAALSTVSYTFTGSTQLEEIYFPRADNPFSAIGYEIQFYMEARGSDEDLLIYPPQVGIKDLQRK